MTNVRRKAPFAVAALAVVLASLFTMRTTQAAFTGTTDNPTNSWSAGTVSLTDNDGGSALFTASNLKPGDGGNACIEVTYTGSLDPLDIKLYVSALTDTDSGAGGTGDALRLSDDIDITVTVYAAGQTCATATPTKTTIFATNTLWNLAAGHTDYSNGIVTWNSTAAGGADAARAFEFTWSLQAAAGNDAQGDSASATFTWEAQS